MRSCIDCKAASGLSGNDRTGIQGVLVVLPMFPEPGEGKQTVILVMDMVSLLARPPVSAIQNSPLKVPNYAVYETQPERTVSL